MLATYESNALLRPALGRIVIRGSARHTPYTPDGLLDAVRKEWNANQASADRDATALVHSHSGGGVAWTGTMGSPTSAQSVNGGSGGFPTIVVCHEIGHNWGASDNHTNGPEGATIVSGNQYARFDGTELSAMMGLRDARLDKFPADAGAYPVALPPYAALDSARSQAENADRRRAEVDQLPSEPVSALKAASQKLTERYIADVFAAAESHGQAADDFPAFNKAVETEPACEG